jgi:hypothetical protein
MGFLLSIGGCQVSYKSWIRDHATNEAKGSKLIGSARTYPFFVLLQRYSRHLVFM